VRTRASDNHTETRSSGGGAVARGIRVASGNRAPFAFAGKRQAPLKINRVARARKGNPEAIESGRVNLVFSREAWEEYLVWQREDPRTVARINQLIKEIMRDPYRGIGKPEPLKHALRGYWSRRINAEHRIVYRVEGDLWIAQLRYHY